MSIIPTCRPFNARSTRRPFSFLECTCHMHDTPWKKPAAVHKFFRKCSYGLQLDQMPWSSGQKCNDHNIGGHANGDSAPNIQVLCDSKGSEFNIFNSMYHTWMALPFSDLGYHWWPLKLCGMWSYHLAWPQPYGTRCSTTVANKKRPGRAWMQQFFHVLSMSWGINVTGSYRIQECRDID